MSQDYIHLRFELGFGPISWLIARSGLPTHNWSHVRPLLDDGSSIDSYESWVHAPRGGWMLGTFPPSIPPGVQHRPVSFRKVKATEIVAVPVSAQQKADWLRFLWDGAKAALAYDHAAIDGFVLGANRHARKSFICSAWGRASGRKIGLGYKSTVPSHEVSPDMLYAIAQEAWGGHILRG